MGAGGLEGHEGRPRQRLFVPWLMAWTACVTVMWVWPGVEVVPFHLAWIAFALIYGFEPWPVPQTLVALAVTTAGAGVVMVLHALDGTLAAEELAEIPLMLIICLLVVWHVQRRDAATRRAAVLARREVGAAERRERLARLTSHEMRTPLTIATGYVDLLIDEGRVDDVVRADLLVVRDELGRLRRTCDRLVRMIRLQDFLPAGPLDVDRLLEATAQRFSTLAERTWVVESDVGEVHGSAERLRACADTLIENALRYTDSSDTIRLLAFRDGEEFWMGVADSGPGLRDDVARRLNGLDPGPTASTDEHSQTGLGLDLVGDIVRARRGRLHAGRSREGGALLVVRLPVVSRAGLGSVAPADPLSTVRDPR